jgi:hypothetical protein
MYEPTGFIYLVPVNAVLGFAVLQKLGSVLTRRVILPTITILDIVHRPCIYLKHDVSETVLSPSHNR